MSTRTVAFHYYNIYLNNKHYTIHRGLKKLDFLKSGQISIGDTVAYIKTKYRTLALTTTTNTFTMKELTSSTGGVDQLNWHTSGRKYPGTYYHNFLPDIMEHPEYSWFLYKVTLDTTGVWGNYSKAVTVTPNNEDLDSSNTNRILWRRFQPTEKVSFTVLLHGGYDFNSVYTQDYGATDIYTATFITNSLFEIFAAGYNSMRGYQLASVIDSSVPLSISTNTGLKYVFNFDSTVNYKQAYETSYQLYGIM